MADYLKALGYQQVTSLSSAATLTVPAGSQRALIQATGQNVRWRDDGTNPTASVGMRITAGDTMDYDAGQLKVIAFIEEAASATLNVSYYGV